MFAGVADPRPRLACPFCNIMLADGIKQRDAEAKVAVLDIAELVAQSIDVPVGSLVRTRTVNRKRRIDLLHAVHDRRPVRSAAAPTFYSH